MVICYFCYWKWSFIVDLPLIDGDFPVRYVNVYQAGYISPKLLATYCQAYRSCFWTILCWRWCPKKFYQISGLSSIIPDRSSQIVWWNILFWTFLDHPFESFDHFSRRVLSDISDIRIFTYLKTQSRTKWAMFISYNKLPEGIQLDHMPYLNFPCWWHQFYHVLPI